MQVHVIPDPLQVIPTPPWWVDWTVPVLVALVAFTVGWWLGRRRRG